MAFKAVFDQEQANRATFKAVLMDYWISINQIYANLLMQNTLLTANSKEMTQFSKRTESHKNTQLMTSYLSEMCAFWALTSPHLKKLQPDKKAGVSIDIETQFKEMDLKKIKSIHQEIAEHTAPLFELSQSVGLEYGGDIPQIKEQKPF